MTAFESFIRISLDKDSGSPLRKAIIKALKPHHFKPEGGTGLYKARRIKIETVGSAIKAMCDEAAKKPERPVDHIWMIVNQEKPKKKKVKK